MLAFLFAFVLGVWSASAAGQSDPASWQLVGQVGGPTQAIAVQGGYAYVGVGQRLVVLNVSGTSSLREVGTTAPFPHFVEGVAVSGTLAYVAAGGAGLRVMDVSDPARPAEVGAWDSPGYAEGVAVAGNTVYLADGPYGLRILDVSSPARPTEVGFVYPVNYAFKVAVAGRYAYIAAAGAGLLIADVSDPTRPVEVGSLDTPGYAYGLAVAGVYAYVADGWEGLRVVNVADPAHPMEVGAYKTPGWAFGVAISGTLAYVADAFKGLRVVNVSNAARPEEVGSFEYPGGHAASVAVAGGIVYVADRNWGVGAFSVSDPGHPALIGFYGPTGFADGVTVAGNYAYVAAGRNGLRVIDISDPAHPAELGAYDTQSYATSVAVAGRYAYVATIRPTLAGQGLHVLDISNPANPIPVGFRAGGHYRDMTLSGGIAYLATEFGLQLIDVSNPSAPAELGYIRLVDWPAGDILSSAVGVAVSGSVAYLASERAGLKIVDVSNPRSPTPVGVYRWPDAFAQDVVVTQGIAYVADTNGLTILDVSNPQQPTRIGFYRTFGFAEGVTVAGNYAYVADGGAGLSVIDVSNPSAPTFVGFYDTPGYAQEVAVANGYVYIADQDGGLSILRPTPTGVSAQSKDLSAVRNRVPSGGTLPLRIGGGRTSFGAAATTVVAGNVVSSVSRAPTTCIVTSPADGGPGTLRECLENAVAGDMITFDPGVFPPASPVTIPISSPLPSLAQGHLIIDASNAGVILDGSSTPPGTSGLVLHNSEGNILRGLQIVRFPVSGVFMSFGAKHNVVVGSYIGTDTTGAMGLGNQGHGVFIAEGSSNNRIGGSSPAERNVISGNGIHGISIHDATGNMVIGNYIGVDPSGRRALGNGDHGVALELGANNNFVKNNVVVATGRNAVLISDWGSSYNTITGNLLGTDATGTVALGGGIGMGGGFNRLGGTTQEDRNTIVGGVFFGRQGAIGNLVLGNFIGTDISGTQGIGRMSTGVGGVVLGNGSRRPFIGGTTAGERNVISGNPFGGVRFDPAVDYVFIGGNYIGTDVSGTLPVGNQGPGVGTNSGRHNIIQNNTIAFNSETGVRVSPANTIRRNSIHSHPGRGIIGSNLPAPVITAVSANGVTGATCSGCTVEIFSDAEDEGRFFEGSTTAGAAGAFTFDKGSPLRGPNITATATDSNGNTSEFSSGRVAGNPIADIKANGADGPVTIPVTAGLSVTVSLTPGTFAGTPGDWWVAAATPFGMYWYSGDRWALQPGVFRQGPLSELGSFEVLNMSNLPSGTYAFYFGVDRNLNGTLDRESLSYDSVVVTVASP